MQERLFWMSVKAAAARDDHAITNRQVSFWVSAFPFSKPELFSFKNYQLMRVTESLYRPLGFAPLYPTDDTIIKN